MTAVRRYQDLRTEDPKTQAFLADSKRWQMCLGDGPLLVGTDWRCVSPFGSVESAVVVDEEGAGTFDRPVYRETPNVNVVAWGMGADGKARFAVITQPRPHADDPLRPGEPNEPIVFGQIVMGFLNAVFGKDFLAGFESGKSGAIREVGEESGAQVILEVAQPQRPWQNPNPTFVATWSELFFVKVDLDVVVKHQSTRGEPIFKAEFITASELRQRVAQGADGSGAWYRMCTANSAWFTFYCCHPELFV